VIAFREASAADGDGITALRTRCFPDEEIDKEFPIARTFIADADGRAVAHLGFIDQTYVIGGQPHPGALAVDAMTDPAYRRQGLFQKLVAFARDAIRQDYALSTAWQIRPAVLPPMTANGWMPLLRAPIFVRFLLPANGPAGGGTPGEDGELRPARESFLEGFAHARLPPWRFDASSYVTTRHLVTRRTLLRGHDSLCVVEVSPDARGDLREALHQARARGIGLAAALLSWRHPSVPLLLRMGFLPSQHRFRFLVNVFDARLDVRRAKWALSWADTDHL
jgi:GNAT superfamily N-acetyltransferase